MNHRQVFLRRIKQSSWVILENAKNGYSPADCVTDILDKAPAGDDHAKWIADNRAECETLIAGIMGLV